MEQSPLDESYQEQWHIPEIPTLRKLRQKDHQNKLQISLGYRAKPCLRRREGKKQERRKEEEMKKKQRRMEKREGWLVLSHSFDHYFIFPSMLFMWPPQHS